MPPPDAFAPGSPLAPPTLPAPDAADERSFGPTAELLRLVVDAQGHRIELLLSDRTTVADTLAAALDLAPLSIRDQAIAHGGWLLRTIGGRALPGAPTLVDLGLGDGTLLSLVGADDGPTAGRYDDIADAIADAVSTEAHTWQPGFGRRVALAAAGVFGVLGILAVLLAGLGTSGLVATALTTAVALAAAGLLSRAGFPSSAAVTAGLLAVGAAVATAFVAVPATGAPLLVTLAATTVVTAAVAGLLIGTRMVPFATLVVTGLLTTVTLSLVVLFDLGMRGGAAVAVLLGLALLPVAPVLAQRLGRFDLEPLPTTVDEVHDDDAVVDQQRIAERTRRAVAHLTALVQGTTWPVTVGAILLAFEDDTTSVVLAGIAGVALLLRSRLFITVGQRLALLIGGLLVLLALLIAQFLGRSGSDILLWVAGPAALVTIVCLALSTRTRRISPSALRWAEIGDLLLAIAAVPLVATVVGLVGFIRGLGG